MIPHDCHIHSVYSGDNEASMEEMCRAAIQRGIPEICFTEHFDTHPSEPRRLTFPLEAWSHELDRCRRLFSGRLIIRAGLEIGEPHRAPAEVEAFVGQYPFDLIIGSLHWVEEQLVFDPAYFERPMDEGYARYFAELEKMTAVGGFDVLGHLDVVARLGFEFWGSYEPARYEQSIRQSLAHCIERGIALDVNAGSLRRKLGRPNPDPTILRWYAQMGGQLVVFSSDAHQPAHVGKHVAEAVRLAAEAGLTRYATYVLRTPRLRALPPRTSA